MYLEGCILGIGALEVVKYYSDVDIAPELYNFYSPLYYLCNVGARLAPSPICGPTVGVYLRARDAREYLTGAREHLLALPAKLQ